jgi:hypothetical protein
MGRLVRRWLRSHSTFHVEGIGVSADHLEWARSPKPEARSPKPEARSPKPEARSPKPRGSVSGVRCAPSAVSICSSELSGELSDVGPKLSDLPVQQMVVVGGPGLSAGGGPAFS